MPKIVTLTEHSDEAFLADITDEANSPRFKVGDKVLIDPAEKPVPGDMVLAITNTVPQRPVFARYTADGLEYLNEDWREAEKVVPLQAVEIFGVMMEHSMPRRPATN